MTEPKSAVERLAALAERELARGDLRAIIAEIKKRDEAVRKVAEEAKGQLDAAGEQLIEAQSLTQERLVILGIEAALAHIREASRLREALGE